MAENNIMENAQEGNEDEFLMPHVLKGMAASDNNFDYDFHHERCREFLINQVGPFACRQAPGTARLVTKCRCLAFLANDECLDEVNGVASYMISWAQKTKMDKKLLIREWLRLSACLEGQCNFMLPTLFVPGDNNGAMLRRLICHNALKRILNIGRKIWEGATEPEGLRPHASVGRKGEQSNRGKTHQDINASLHEFFSKLKEVAVPFATRLVREETGTVTRDDNPEDVALPPHLTKHRCYANWCWQRGWRAVKFSKSQTIYKAISEYPKRPHDDESEVPLWPSGTPSLPVCSWSKFWYFWREWYPNIKVRARGADTCSDCLKMLHGLKYSPLLPSAQADEEAIEQSVQNNINELQKKKREAESHVRQYQAQRKFANFWIHIARLDRILPSLFHRHYLTVDMGQNIGLPNFAGNQPGDTYYMTPITLYLFGVADNSKPKDSERLNAYVWHEKDGRRGANNIASCLLADYKARGYFSSPNFGSLTIIADNCGGQNKNEDVIRFHLWLVEAGIFPCVRIVFLIKGHTKNACDRLFNLLKLDYHYRDIFTYSDMIEKLDTNDHVEVRSLSSGDFYDFHTVLNKYYRSLKSGETNRTHVFTIYSKKYGREPTTLYKQDDCNAPERVDSLLPTSRNKNARYMTKEERNPLIKNMLSELELCKEPGMPAMKEVELWIKWRPLLPPYARDVTCPKPSDDVIKQVREERSAKRRKTKKEEPGDSISLSLKLGI